MPDYYVVEVTLQKIIPRIWRRFKISAEAMFVDLHEAIQDACGWKNCHLFQFKDAKGRVLAGLPDGPDDVTTPDAQINPIRKTLGLRKGRSLIYVYDFGDYWIHDVKVVDTELTNSDRLARVLLAGERAFPPEDCGGLSGYRDCVKVSLERKKDPQLRRWLENWEPEKFDLKATSRFFNQRRLIRRAHYIKSYLSDDDPR